LNWQSVSLNWQTICLNWQTICLNWQVNYVFLGFINRKGAKLFEKETKGRIWKRVLFGILDSFGGMKKAYYFSLF
jgi:hypothetical protein